MAIYRLDVDKKFGQLHLRLYPQGEKAPGAGPSAADIKALIDQLGRALEPLDLKDGADSVIFRGIEYKKKFDLQETVRFSKF